MSLHKVFHAGLAASQISKWGAKEESGMAKYAKDTVFGYVYQELKKQTRVKTQWISGRWPVRWFWQCYTLTEGHDVMAANCDLVKRISWYNIFRFGAVSSFCMKKSDPILHLDGCRQPHCVQWSFKLLGTLLMYVSACSVILRSTIAYLVLCTVHCFREITQFKMILWAAVHWLA